MWTEILKRIINNMVYVIFWVFSIHSIAKITNNVVKGLHSSFWEIFMSVHYILHFFNIIINIIFRTSLLNCFENVSQMFCILIYPLFSICEMSN